jgi:hypothetical protein
MSKQLRRLTERMSTQARLKLRIMSTVVHISDKIPLCYRAQYHENIRLAIIINYNNSIIGGH